MPDAVLIAIITVAPVMILNLALSFKSLAETKKIKLDTGKARAELTPNHGSSLKDTVVRTDGRVKELATSVGGVRDDLRLERAALHSHMRDSQTVHESLDHRLGRIEERVLSAATPSSILQPPPPRRTQ